MATINANTSITLPAGSTLTFTEGGSGQAIVAGNIYTIGLSDVFLGPFASAQIITVLLFNGPISYYTQIQPVANANRVPVVTDPLTGATSPDISTVDIVEIDGATTLSIDPETGHNGKVLRCSTAVTLTYPEGLGDAFSCLVEPPASGDVTIDPTGDCTLNGATASLTRDRADNPAGFVIRALGEDVGGVSGA